MSFLIIILLLSTISLTHGKVFTNCELVKELSKYVPKDEVYFHLCVTARNTSRQTDGFYGIYMINTCGAEKKGSACSLSCDKFIDENITDDIGCAKEIFKLYSPNKAAIIKRKCEAEKKIVEDCLKIHNKPIFTPKEPSGDYDDEDDDEEVSGDDENGSGEGSGYSMRGASSFSDDEDFYEDKMDAGLTDFLGSNFPSNLTTTPFPSTALENDSSIYFSNEKASSRTPLNKSLNKSDSSPRENDQIKFCETSCFSEPLTIIIMTLFGFILMITIVFLTKCIKNHI